MTELPTFNRWLDTFPLNGGQWVVVLALALVMPIVVELDKAFHRWREAKDPSSPLEVAIVPSVARRRPRRMPRPDGQEGVRRKS